MIRTKLLEMMHYRCMSMMDLAEAADLSIDTVKNVIYGRVAEPRFSTLIPICDALDCSLDYVLNRGCETLQQARELPPHSVRLIEKMVDAEFSLKYSSDGRTHEYRSVIIPNTFTSDHILYDSCVIGYIDIISTAYHYPGEEITCGLMLQGNELDPVYFDGDILLLNGARHPRSNEIGLYLGDDRQFYIRRYMFHPDRTGHLYSLTPNKEAIPMKKRKFKCFGTVLGVFRGKMQYTLPEDIAL